MKLIILLVAAAIIVALFTAIVMAYINGIQAEKRHHTEGLPPDDIVVKANYARCTIRAERASKPSKQWPDVRIAFFLPNAKQPVDQLFFETWSREDMATFEERLDDLGFARHASGTSNQMTVSLDRMQRMVIYTR